MRLSRAPHMEFKSLLAPMVAPGGRALEYFRLIAKETDNTLVDASAGGRELFAKPCAFCSLPTHPESVERARHRPGPGV